MGEPEVVALLRQVVGQFKTPVAALKSPLNGLVSNWASMVKASLAWSLKA